MKKFLKISIYSFIILNLMVFSSYALTITYTDIYANWPGWFINPNDEIGTPIIQDIQAVTIEIDDNTNFLKKVTIYETGRRVWDTLFINSDWDGTYDDYQKWDYYVYDDDLGDGGHKIYSVTNPYTYILATNPGGWTGRWGHPAGIKSNYLTEIDILNYVIWNDGSPGTLVYSFKEGIKMEGKFVIGYSQWCANDVFLTPVPEPELLILLGIGLTGVGILARRHRKV